MTTPSIIFFGYDQEPRFIPKIFIRALLFSSAERGNVVETMFAKITYGQRDQLFTFWGFGERRELVAGGGLYVGRTGFAANHHFVLSVHEQDYPFNAGEYRLEFLARTVGRKKPISLGKVRLDLPQPLSDALRRREGVMFERMPDGDYRGHSQQRPEGLDGN